MSETRFSTPGEDSAKGNELWSSILLDAGDGSGDAIIPLPDDLLAELGWNDETELEIIAEKGKIVLHEKGADEQDPFAFPAAITDALSTASRALKDNAPKFADNAKKHTIRLKNKVAKEISYTMPYIRARDAWYDAKASHEKELRGYSSVDAWNVGSSTLHHFAELLAIMSCETFSAAPDGWEEQLAENAMILNGYYAAYNEMELMWFHEGFHNKKASKKVPKPVMERIPKFLRDKVKESWSWIGVNIISDNFVSPDGYDEYRVPPEHSIYEDGYLSSYEADWLPGKKPKDLAKRKAMRRLERKHSQTGVSRADIADAPCVELRRLSALLYEMARGSHGYPEGYLESEDQLQSRGEHWNENQAISASLMGNPSVIEHEVTYSAGENMIGIKRNRDVGDYAAWIEDISDAASIFSQYACWLAPDGLKAALEAAQVPAADIARLGRLHREQFERAWNWMGNLLEGLWA